MYDLETQAFEQNVTCINPLRTINLFRSYDSQARVFKRDVIRKCFLTGRELSRLFKRPL